MESDTNFYSFDDIYVDTPTSTTSWASIIEEELQQSGKLEEVKIGDSNEKKELKEISSNEILKTDVKQIDDIHNIFYQRKLTQELKNSFEFTKDFFKKTEFYLQWIKKSSNHLVTSLNLPDYKNRLEKNISIKNIIPRSSYKFCKYKQNCDFNYDKKNYEGCFAQHYVHNMVYSDVKILLKYLSLSENFSDYNEQEIKKSLETLYFVINHMYEEMYNASKMYGSNNINFHVERSPTKKFNKKLRNKKKNKNKNLSISPDCLIKKVKNH